MKNRKVVLVSRPEGVPKEDDFKIVTEELNPSLKKGEVLVRNKWLSVDPAQRVWISGARSYTAPVELNEVIKGFAVGVIISSSSGVLRQGQYVFGMMNWQEYCVMKACELQKIPSNENPRLYTGVFGINGLAAYFAVLGIARPRENETMVVSTAAGALGSVACQIGKIKGCKVIGITGSDQKANWLTNDLKIDGAINYKTCESVSKELKKLCPEGIDIYIDNVGGDTLDSVLLNIRKYARVILCGAMASYNSKKAPSISFYPLVISTSAVIEGFIVWDFKNRFEMATQNLRKWVHQGRIKYKEHVFEGIENSPRALKALLSGENLGKTVIKLAHSEPKL